MGHCGNRKTREKFAAMKPFLILICLLGSVVPTLGHAVDQHFLKLTLEDGHASGRLEMDAGYALPEIRRPKDDTLPTGAWLDQLSENERERILGEGRKYLQSVLQFQIETNELPVEISFAKWGTDWPMFFDQRPDTFARMVWDIRIDYDKHSGNLELFWNESEQGPSLALQTVSDDRELALITVSQGEEHTLAFIKNKKQEPSSPEPSRSSNRWLPVAIIAVVLLVAGAVWRFFR
jgi:hypothetical protein